MRPSVDALVHGNPLLRSLSLSDGIGDEPSPGLSDASNFSLAGEGQTLPDEGGEPGTQEAGDGDDICEDEVELLRNSNESESGEGRRQEEEAQEVTQGNQAGANEGGADTVTRTTGEPVIQTRSQENVFSQGAEGLTSANCQYKYKSFNVIPEGIILVGVMLALFGQVGAKVQDLHRPGQGLWISKTTLEKRLDERFDPWEASDLAKDLLVKHLPLRGRLEGQGHRKSYRNLDFELEIRIEERLTLWNIAHLRKNSFQGQGQLQGRPEGQKDNGWIGLLIISNWIKGLSDSQGPRCFYKWKKTQKDSSNPGMCRWICQCHLIMMKKKFNDDEFII